ncbi:MAG: ribonuclease H-like domain-containing protein [Patescibacteria group bacterium]|nr:ribonuclease H-like domain-containing protein [Patescibacteria group bacterium]
MKSFPIVLDLETKYSFRDFSDPKKLQISVVSVFEYKTNKIIVFEEKEINRLFPLIEKSSCIVGFNIISFDLQVLQAYYPGNLKNFKVFDILNYIKEKIGKRISLNEIVFATLNKKKSGSGLEAINLYREGKIEQLKKYCQDDVLLTKELFDYGAKNGEIFYFEGNKKNSIKVDWKKYFEEKQNNETHLTLPF